MKKGNLVRYWTLACWGLGILHGLCVRVRVAVVCVLAGAWIMMVFMWLRLGYDYILLSIGVLLVVFPRLLVYILLADVIGHQCVNDEGERCQASGLVVMLLQYGYLHPCCVSIGCLNLCWLSIRPTTEVVVTQ